MNETKYTRRIGGVEVSLTGGTVYDLVEQGARPEELRIGLANPHEGIADARDVLDVDFQARPWIRMKPVGEHMHLDLRDALARHLQPLLDDSPFNRNLPSRANTEELFSLVATNENARQAANIIYALQQELWPAAVVRGLTDPDPQVAVPLIVGRALRDSGIGVPTLQDLPPHPETGVSLSATQIQELEAAVLSAVPAVQDRLPGMQAGKRPEFVSYAVGSTVTPVLEALEVPEDNRRIIINNISRLLLAQQMQGQASARDPNGP